MAYSGLIIRKNYKTNCTVRLFLESQSKDTEKESKGRKDTKKKIMERKASLLRPMDAKRVNLFIIYFMALMILSSISMVYYWPHKTIEERISALNDMITKDNTEKQEIVKKLQGNSSSSGDFSSNEKQRLLQRYQQLNQEIDQSQSLMDTYKWKINFDTFSKSNFEWIHLDIVKNFAIVGLSGLLASTIASFRSFYNFYGNRRLKVSWTVFYIFRPWQGVLLAIIIFIIIRSGIQAGIGVTSDQISANLFAIATVGFIAGLYSEEVLNKFHEIFVTLFTTKDERKDQLTPPKKYPATVAEVIGYTVFPDEVTVRFHNKQPDPTTLDSKCPGAFSSNEAYWEVLLQGGDEGVYWIRDSDQQIVCQYKPDHETTLPDTPTESKSSSTPEAAK